MKAACSDNCIKYQYSNTDDFGWLGVGWLLDDAGLAALAVSLILLRVFGWSPAGYSLGRDASR